MKISERTIEDESRARQNASHPNPEDIDVTQFKLRSLSLAASLAAGAILASPVANAQSIDVTKMCACQVTALSADGSAATGMSDSNYAVFRWTKKDGIKTLGRTTAKFLGGMTAGVPAISEDGRTIAATIIDDTKTYGTEGRWTAGSGWQQLGVPADGGVMDSFDSSVFGMSGDGNTVTGLYWRPGQPGGSAHGSVWTAATGNVGMQTAGRSSRIDGANYDGTVLCGWEQDPKTGVRQTVVWRNGVKTFIDDGNGQGWPSEASYLNHDGTIVVGQAINPATYIEEATMWKWDGATWQKTSLGAGPNADGTGNSYALGVSDDGSVVVGLYVPTFGPARYGFIWTADAGLVDAQAWMTAHGSNVDKRLSLFEVSAVTRDGRAMSMVGYQNTAPYAVRSLLVTMQDGQQLK
jgi:uncharacterized membrane protein